MLELDTPVKATHGDVSSRSITIVQLGDIHFPEYKDVRAVDAKDKGFPAALLDHLAPKRLQGVIRKLVGLIDSDSKSSLSAILVSGDLTSKGCLAGYKECIKYLCETLRLAHPTTWRQDQIHIVPGNHDVDRNSIDSSSDLFSKFSPLQEAWSECGLPILTTSKARHSTIGLNDRRIDLFSLNSCLGCGSKDYFPGQLREELFDLISKSGYDVKAIQLDTPAFDAEALSEVTETIRSLTKTTIPIVLGHHNILPQAEPRIELYTEAVNGGLLRSRLSQLSRPVIYCHGHLHKDPVEIILSAKLGRGRLISISAPLLSDGFNTLEIQYSRSGIPIGCIIKPYRMRDDGDITHEEPIRISLWGQRDALHTSSDEVLSITLDCVGSSIVRFAKLLQNVNTSAGHQIDAPSFIDFLLELEWAGMISIISREEDHIHWQIQRADP